MQKNITAQYVVKKDELEHIAMAVRKKRANKGLTQSELAKKAKVSPSYISYVEVGTASAISREKLSAIAKALKAEARDLIGRKRPTDNVKIDTHDTDELLSLEETVLRPRTDRELATSEYNYIIEESHRNKRNFYIALLAIGVLIGLLIVAFFWA